MDEEINNRKIEQVIQQLKDRMEQVEDQYRFLYQMMKKTALIDQQILCEEDLKEVQKQNQEIKRMLNQLAAIKK